MAIALSVAALRPGGGSLVWAEQEGKFPPDQVEAVDECGDRIAISLADLAQRHPKKAACIVWDRACERLVWRLEGVAFPHFVAEGKELLGLRPGRVLAWHDTKTGKELRRQQIALPKDWEGGDDVWFNQVENLSLLSGKKEVIVTVYDRLFRHRLADGKTFFQPEDEKTFIRTKRGSTKLYPRGIRTPKGVQDRFVTMIDGTTFPEFGSNHRETYFAQFVLWDARTLRPIRRWAPAKGEFARGTAISVDGRLVAGLAMGLEVKEEDGVWRAVCVVWDARTGKAVHDPLWKAEVPDLAPLGGCDLLAFSDDSKLLASQTDTDRVGVFEVRSGRRIETLKLPASKDPHVRIVPSYLQFSADGQRLYVGTVNGGLYIWDQPGRQPAANRKPSQIISLDKLLK